MSNRFEKAINLKKSQMENNNEILDENINVNTTENNNENLSGKSMLLKEKLKNIDNNKTQITINLKNENLKKLDILAKETNKSRAYIVDYLLENYL